MYSKILPFWICLIISTSCFSQDNPCHCIDVGFSFYTKNSELNFKPFGGSRFNEGKLIQVYKADYLTAIAVIEPPDSASTPKIEHINWRFSQNSEIAFRTNWYFDLRQASENRNNFALKNKVKISDLHTFDFLPRMNSEVKLKIYIMYSEEYVENEWPLSKDKIDMIVDASIPAHPLYSDWNSKSPFSLQMPSIKLKLQFFRNYKWQIKVENGTKITKELVSLKP